MFRSPAAVITKLRSDAAAQPASYGFTGDPSNSVGGHYYGYLVIANDLLTPGKP